MRPRKEGLDYFPLDVDFGSDEKFVAIQAEFGGEGVFVALRLLADIYRAGYCVRNSPETHRVVAFKYRIDAELLEKVIRKCIEVDLFSAEIHEKTGYLTSRGIQKRFFSITRKRASFAVIPGVWVLTGEFPQVSDAETMGESAQSKTKQSKAKQSKEKETKIAFAVPAHASPLFRKKFEEWIAYRSKNRFPTSESTKWKLIETYLVRPDEFAAAVDHSILNGYRGLFPPKNAPPNGHGSAANTNRLMRERYQRGELKLDEMGNVLP